MTTFTPDTADVRGAYHAWHDGQGDTHPEKPTWSFEEFDRWLEAHDREVRADTLRTAAETLRGDQEVRDRNGVGWLPTNSLMGAARVLEHLASRQ